MQKAFFLLFAALLAVSPLGCGGGTNLKEISGQVTLDGQPIESGSITFVPEGKGTAEGANLVGGKYTVSVSPGKLKVSISATRPHPTEKVPDANPDAPMVPKMVQYIPAKYNEATELTITVEKGGSTHDFQLKSN